jgi:hypothetical protein
MPMAMNLSSSRVGVGVGVGVGVELDSQISMFRCGTRYVADSTLTCCNV